MPAPGPGTDRARAFIAIALEAGAIAALKELQHRLADRVPEEGVRWVRPGQIHLTLHFLGNVERDRLPGLAGALGEACSGTPPFDLGLAAVGCFPHTRQPRVVWVGLSGDLAALARVQNAVKRLTQPFGDHLEDRDFKPHLTLGRVSARGHAARRVGEAISSAPRPDPAPWTVREIHLMRSDLTSSGPRYEELAKVRLDQDQD